MSEQRPMKVEPTGWIHVVPYQPGDRNVVKITVVVGGVIGIIPLLTDTMPNGASLVIFIALGLCLLVLPPLFRVLQPKVNICPECNIRTTYNPDQKFCGRCGYRPGRT